MRQSNNHAITVIGAAVTEGGLDEVVSMAPVRSGAETAVEKVLYTDAITRGALWECAPGIYPRHKVGQSSLQFIISGAANIMDADGTEHAITGGSVLITPDGWEGTWHITETIRKFYVHTYTPSAMS